MRIIFQVFIINHICRWVPLLTVDCNHMSCDAFLFPCNKQIITFCDSSLYLAWVNSKSRQILFFFHVVLMERVEALLLWILFVLKFDENKLRNNSNCEQNKQVAWPFITWCMTEPVNKNYGMQWAWNSSHILLNKQCILTSDETDRLLILRKYS